MATKTLRVTLADILDPVGPAGAVSGEVWARYSSEVRLTDGTIVVLANRRQSFDAAGVADFTVVPNNDATIHGDYVGFGIVVGWDLTYRGEHGARVQLKEAGRTITVTSADAAVVAFGLKAPAVPTTPLLAYPTEATVNGLIATAGAGYAPALVSGKAPVRQGTVTLYAGDYADLQAALTAADAQPAGTVRRVLAPGAYNITTNLLIGDNTILDGCGTGVITKTSASAFKMILSKNAAAGGTIPATSGIVIKDITLVGDGAGTEFSAGIHLAKAARCVIDNVKISNVLGDGITIGNITGGVAAETCTRVRVVRCDITTVGRMGIALTNAEHCTVDDNDIHDFAGATSLTGVGIDLEPDSTGELIRYNHVTNNRISNTRSGVFGCSSVSMSAANSLGNHVTGNIIHGMAEEGVKFSYSHATISGNTIDTVGLRGIWLVNPSQADGFVVSDNIIRDAGTTTDVTYAAILLDTIVHSQISGNIFYATVTNKISKMWDEIGGCAYNTFQGNNGRQTGKAFSNVATSVASHNLVSIAIANNTHEAFVANGKVVAAAGTTGAASLNVPHGAAPTSPANGDMWTTTAGLFVRVNGATVGPLT